MTSAPHICVFYSKGRTFTDVLSHVKARQPNARLCALVPAGYPVSEAGWPTLDEVVQTGLPRYSWRNPLSFMRLVRQIRRPRYDAFVIAFDSPRLRVLSALSGATRLYCAMDGQLLPLHGSISGTLADVLIRSIRGRLTYAYIWLIVRLLHVSSPDKP
jgi:hypothetical protein